MACPRAAHKTETYRSLRFLQLAALVPSAGTITLQIELRSARLPLGNRVHALRCLQRSARPSL